MKNLRQVDIKCCGRCSHFIDVETYPSICGQETNPYQWLNPYDLLFTDEKGVLGRNERWEAFEEMRTLKEIQLSVTGAYHICDLFEEKPS